jgi:hypothetical protein
MGHIESLWGTSNAAIPQMGDIAGARERRHHTSLVSRETITDDPLNCLIAVTALSRETLASVSPVHRCPSTFHYSGAKTHRSKGSYPLESLGV